jgi:ATP-binding cassette subfamily B protein
VLLLAARDDAHHGHAASSAPPPPRGHRKYASNVLRARRRFDHQRGPVRAFAQARRARIRRREATRRSASIVGLWELRVDLASPCSSSQRAGLILALWVSGRTGASLEVVFITFSYYSSATRVMWEFNRIYRSLEGALTDAAQFAELLLDPPSVVDADATDVFSPADFGVELRDVSFRYSPSATAVRSSVADNRPAQGRAGRPVRRRQVERTECCCGLPISDQERFSSAASRLARCRRLRCAADRVCLRTVDVPPQHRRQHQGGPARCDGHQCGAQQSSRTPGFIERLAGRLRHARWRTGVKLSGGQRQHGDHRAILKDAPILVLDEATSALDSESEALIQDALWTLLAGRTAIVIAHRLSTVRRMDELIILDRGRLVERGSHDALLVRDGVYASLWAHQSGGFLAEDTRAQSVMR